MPFTDEEARLIREAAAAHNIDAKLAEYQLLIAHADSRLRDTFAKAALPGVIAKCGLDTLDKGETLEELFARKSYKIADAMMTERKK